jgi:glucose/arabinose dehydrogenase
MNRKSLLSAWRSLVARRPRRHTARPTLEILEDRLTPTTLPPGFTETLVNTQGAFSSPTRMEFAPDGRLFVLEQGGNVKLVQNGGTSWIALHLSVDSAGERGLLGIAFDPNYATNHFVYLYYTNPSAGAASWATGEHNQISRFTVNDSNPQQPTLTNEAPILDLNNLISATNHNGGDIHFGTDGMLYVDVGDNTQTFVLNGNTYRVSQTLANMLGKQLRVDVSKFNSGVATRDDTVVGHLIPSDNPFVNTASGINQLIYVLGLRNPYSFAVQPGTGTMYINDVGEVTWEEINLDVAGSNYGWSGGNTDGFGQTPPGPGPYRDPLMAYDHSNSLPSPAGTAITGGVFYPSNSSFGPAYAGKYFFTDLGGRFIRVFDPAHPGSLATPDTSTDFASNLTTASPVGVKVDAAGNLYYLAGAGSSSGAVYRISFQSSGTATFAGTDTATQGSWEGVYGSNGYSVVNDATSYPNYAQVSVTGAGTYTWVGSTNDVRALQKASTPGDRIAATYYSFTNFTIDVNITDGGTHRLALYLLDWDSYLGGRSERVDVLDAGTGTVLDTRNVSSFSAGQYLAWNVKGHVQFRVTNTGSSNNTALVGGLFFDPTSSGSPTGTASYLTTDPATQGNWQGVYGFQGYSVVNDATSYPTYAQVGVFGAGTYTWAGSTSDVRALQKATNPSDRIAATYYSFGTFTIDVNITDGATHRLALYFLDWDSYQGGRSERIDVLDAGTGAVLDTRSVTSFSAGEYLTWNLTGQVRFRVTNTGANGNTCLVAGLFFDTVGSSPTGSATYLTTDLGTQGTWQGVYGAQGYSVVNDATSYPSYAQVSVTGAGTYTWAASTTDIRALQKTSTPGDRIAATYYSFTNFTIDVNITDGGTHRLALYLLDWDSYLGGRSERIDVLDAGTGQVLDTRNVSNFSAGQYLTWNLTGHVRFRVTNTGSGNNTCLVAGLFFDGPGNNPSTGTASYVTTDLGTQGTWHGVYGAQGYSVINDATSYPSYAQVSVYGAGTYTWAASTTDARALQKATNPNDRIASTYYSFSSFLIDMNLTDGAQHRVALYFLDWDSYLGGRSERIEVLDAGTGAVLDTRNLSNFSAGEYLVWNLKGHVRIRVTNTASSNNTALAGGLFFG